MDSAPHRNVPIQAVLFANTPVEAVLFPQIETNYVNGRDELNLAEFPISAIGDRVDPNIKTIVYQDETHDRSTGKMVGRKLTITASDLYGLPTASDDEILLGLLQLSRLRNFDSPTLVFTPYSLLGILGWSPRATNYARVKEALQRWLGVTFYYENAWRDKETGAWVDANFHFLEDYHLHKPGHRSAKAPDGMSMIRWNEGVFKSFQAGNLKALNFQFYRALKSGVAKRMFRFLDKRFYHRSRLTFDLEAFACEKIGLKRPVKKSKTGETTEIALIKRRLSQAIQELEENHFIKPLPHKQRFVKDAIGTWEINFERENSPQDEDGQGQAVDLEDLTPIEGRLVGHGVSRPQARRLTSEFNDDRIEAQLDAIEYLLAKGGNSVPKSSAGWLVSAIKADYGMPPGFKSRKQIEEETQKKARTKLDREAKERLQKAEEKAEFERQEKQFIDRKNRALEYLESLSQEKRDEIEEDIPFLKLMDGQKISLRLRETCLINHVCDLLEGNG